MWLFVVAACAPEPHPAGPSSPRHPTGHVEPPLPPTVSDLGVGFAMEGVGITAVLGDVTGDGQLDLVESDDEALYVFAGPVVAPRTADEADAVVTVAAGGNVVPTIAGDLDGNGIDDVACGIWNSVDTGGTRIVLGPLTSPSIVELAAPDFRRSLFPSHAPLGDLDGDGDHDLAIAWPYDNGYGGRVFLVDAATTAGAPGLPSAWASATAGLESQLGMDLEPAGDLDRDGTIDLVVSDPWNERVYVVYTGGWSGQRAVSDLGATIVRSDGAGETILAGGGDGNGDGRLDLVIGGVRKGGQICVVLDVPDAGVHAVEDLGPCWELPTNVAGWQAAWVPDLDGDGLDEVAFTTGDTERGTLYVLRGDQIVAGAPLDEAPIQIDVRSIVLEVGDLTGDGVPDLVLNDRGNTWVVEGDRLAVLLRP